MITLTHKDNLGSDFTVFWDDLQIEVVDSIERSIFYKCSGYDSLGRQYTGVAEFCCDELEGISDVERISHMHRNKKPFQTRKLLKSIRYWQSVVNGLQSPKRPLAYYKNKLSYYHESDIKYLEEQAIKGKEAKDGDR